MASIPRQRIDREALATALERANISLLLPILAELTDDLSWVSEPFLPERIRGLVDDPTGGLSEELQQQVRDAALDAVLAWHAGTPARLGTPDRGTLLAIMSASIGRQVPEEYADIFAAELRIEEPAPATAGPTPLGTDVVIVGAGFSGMRAAIEFRDRGIPFTILERNDDVGGVWLTSVYPGAGVDTPSELYSLSTDPYPWSTTFARQPEVLDYARRVAEDEGLRARIHFGTEVTGATWDEDAERWELATRTSDGDAGTVSARVLVSAVGTFGTAAFPDIPGIADFDGPVLHTAEWPIGTDLAGRRVAVVGAGASAMQLVPKIVDEVEELVLFQRTPQWISPVADYFEPIPPEVHRLTDWVPGYRDWWRFRLATIWNDGAYPALTVDRAWEDFPRSVNRINASQRRYFERYLREQLAGREDLIEVSIPSYPPFGKRLLLDNGWFAAIRRENVRVVPRGITSVDAGGVTDDAGQHHDVDVLVFATGFSAADYLSTLPVTGRSGVALDDVWHHDDAAAYLGMAVPGFPNLFIMYGPNIHPGPGGSYLFLAEAAARYIADAVAFLDAEGGALEVVPEVFRTYQDEVDDANARLVWGTDLVRSYAKNAAGRVVTNLPWRVSDYWLRTEEFRPQDYARGPEVSAR
jgi:4-hydroxyacetophenone monooxygenase